MPSYGEKQKPAGVKKADMPKCSTVKSMRRKINGFKIASPEYKANAVLNANK